MRILITAGNTQVRIDKVRCLTNIFTGRTGANIALQARQRGHEVTLLTSHPETAKSQGQVPYSTFEDLQTLMREIIQEEHVDAVIHSAAVSDYLAGGVFAPAPGTNFDPSKGCWTSNDSPPALVDRQAGKVKSDEPELWLRLVRAPKLVDLLRTEWGFRGVLVKFKLEVGLSDEALVEIAERSRIHSAADLMVANSLEGASTCAYLGPRNGLYQRVSRDDLADRLLDTVEELHGERSHG